MLSSSSCQVARSSVGSALERQPGCLARGDIGGLGRLKAMLTSEVVMIKRATTRVASRARLFGGAGVEASVAAAPMVRITARGRQRRVRFEACAFRAAQGEALV